MRASQELAVSLFRGEYFGSNLSILKNNTLYFVKWTYSLLKSLSFASLLPFKVAPISPLNSLTKPLSLVLKSKLIARTVEDDKQTNKQKNEYGELNNNNNQNKKHTYKQTKQ